MQEARAKGYVVKAPQHARVSPHASPWKPAVQTTQSSVWKSHPTLDPSWVGPNLWSSTRLSAALPHSCAGRAPHRSTHFIPEHRLERASFCDDRFHGNTITEGYVDEDRRGHCVSPLLYRTGLVSVEISENNTTFNRVGSWLSGRTSITPPTRPHLDVWNATDASFTSGLL